MQNDLTLIALLIDRSGSMASIRDATEKGINGLLTEQRRQPGRAIVSIYKFDSNFDVVCEAKPISEVAPFRLEPRDATALLDAIANSIDRTGRLLADMPEDQRPAKVIFTIATDGLENASTHTTYLDVASRITLQRDVYNWQFLYLGANQDAIAEAAKIGIDRRFAVDYAPCVNGTVNAIASVSRIMSASRVARTNEEMQKAAAFTQKDRDRQQHLIDKLSKAPRRKKSH